MLTTKAKENISNFTAIPNEIFDDENLSMAASMAYFTLCRYLNNEGNTAFPSYATIAKNCKYSKNTAIKAIQELLQAGYLTKEERMSDYGGHDSNLYTLNHVSQKSNEDIK